MAGLFSAPSGGGDVTNVAPLHAPGISSAPIYSPDLKSTVHLELDGGKRLILSKRDGSGSTELSSLLMATGSLALSSPGTRITSEARGM